MAKDAEEIIPDPLDTTKRRKPTILTTDLSLRMDPIYGPISKRFYENPDQFAEATCFGEDAREQEAIICVKLGINYPHNGLRPIVAAQPRSKSAMSSDITNEKLLFLFFS